MHQKAEQNHQLHDYLVLLKTLQSLEQYREFYYQLYLLATINTDRAFTGHEQISELSGLIHSERLRNDNSLSFLVSNARIYDSDIGRFLSADTIIQDPHDSQAYNRYSYARNNPMMFTDPSGHSWWSDNEQKIKNIVIGVIVAILVVYTGGAILAGMHTTLLTASLSQLVVSGAIAGAVGGFATGMLHGATFDASLQMAGSGALYGGIGAGVASVIGSAWGASTSVGARAGRALMHGMSRAAISKSRGGKWSAGFWSGLASSALAPLSASASTFEGKIAMSAIVGGTASELGGGKFANGAVTGAFVMMYNDMRHDRVGRSTLNSLIKSMPRLDSDFEYKMFDRYWNSKGDYTLSKAEFNDILSRSVGRVNGTDNSITISLYSDDRYDFAIGVATLYYSSNNSKLNFYDNYNFDYKPWGTRSVFAEMATRQVNNEGRFYGASSFDIRY